MGVYGYGATKGKTLHSPELINSLSRQIFYPAFRLSQKVLPRPLSNHFPICLGHEGIQWGPTPFRLDNRWLKTDGFCALVEKVWSSTGGKGTANFKLAKKLKCLKEELKKWATSASRTQKLEIIGIMTELERMDKAEGNAGLSNEDKEKRKLLKINLAKKFNMEAIS